MEYIDDNRLLQKIAAPIQWEKNKPNQNKTVKLFSGRRLDTSAKD